MSYVQLTRKEQGQIEVLIRLSRELKRARPYGDYQAERAHSGYQERKKNCGAKPKHTAPTLKLIQQKLLGIWSPEQIEHRLFEEKLCFKTIYRWIYDGPLELAFTVLRQKTSDGNLERRAVDFP